MLPSYTSIVVVDRSLLHNKQITKYCLPNEKTDVTTFLHLHSSGCR
jgi:hypothetical protein